MNRNTEVHFANIPSVEIGRSKFDRSHTKWTTIDAGRLYPVYVDCTIMPGDTVKMRTSELIRMMTPVAPVMDDCFADITAWFVPHRLVWPHFKRFMGENDTAPWAQQTEYTVPFLTGNTEDATWKSGSLLDYLGYPVYQEEEKIGNTSYFKSPKGSALPVRAYNLIWNEFWRDENLQNPVNIDLGDSDTYTVPYEADETDDDYVTDSTYGGLRPLKVCKVPDYFTMCLPAPQKGPAVTLPLQGTAPIRTKTFDAKYDSVEHTYGRNSDNLYLQQIDHASGPERVESYLFDAVRTTGTESDDYDRTAFSLAYGQLFADLSQATGATVNALRQAFAIQKFYERQARGGTRYIEMVKSHFGVTNPDFRLQRPEYLGGHRVLINMNQVVATTVGTNQPLGDTGAYSVTQNTDEDMFTHSFTEHGTLMITICIRQRHSYTQGINRQFTMRKITDFYFPEFANLGEQAVLKKELVYNGDTYADGKEGIHATDDEAFGYQEAWAHYRYFPDSCTGLMRPNISNSLGATWTYADNYSEVPTLGDKWIEETKDNINRTLAIQNKDQFLVNIYFGAIYTRPMPLYSIPGLIDHH